jgi:hypothetical protein
MTIQFVCVLISAVSFYFYGAAYFLSPHIKAEFRRFKLERIGVLVVGLELLGATGLLVGLKYNPLLMASSLGLGVLMLCGLIVRIKFKDSFLISIPAFFFMILNFFIFFQTLKFQSP